jgi:hypothetical protein
MLLSFAHRRFSFLFLGLTHFACSVQYGSGLPFSAAQVQCPPLATLIWLARLCAPRSLNTLATFCRIERRITRWYGATDIVVMDGFKGCGRR